MIAWLLALMFAFAPPDKAWQAPSHPETVAQRKARYADIARDIAAVVKAAKPLPGLTRRQTAGLLLAVAIGESGLAADADLGPCYRARETGRCDGGLAVGLWQTWVPPVHQPVYWRDRQRAARLALQRLRLSMGACRRSAPRYRLAAYASGSCQSRAGRRGSASRWGLFVRLMAWRPRREASDG